MCADYKIEKIGPEDIGKVSQLYKICFGRDMGIDLLKWKYFQNPDGESLLLGAKFNGNIIGSCVMLPETFSIFGKPKKVYKCADLMVSPDHRNKGLAGGLIQSLCEDLKKKEPLFLYTMCSKTATRSFRKNNWIKLGDLYTYFKHNSQLKVESLFTNPGRLYRKGILRPINSISELCVERNFSVNENMISTIKGESYLGWRLGDPRYKYSIIGYYDKDILAGYAVYGLGPRNIAYLIDINVNDHDNAQAVRALLDAVEFNALKTNRRLLIALALEGSAFQKVVKKGNYMRNPFSKGPLTSIMDFNIFTDEAYGEKARNRANWDILPINYDGI